MKIELHFNLIKILNNSGQLCCLDGPSFIDESILEWHNRPKVGLFNPDENNPAVIYHRKGKEVEEWFINHKDNMLITREEFEKNK